MSLFNFGKHCQTVLQRWPCTHPNRILRVLFYGCLLSVCPLWPGVSHGCLLSDTLCGSVFPMVVYCQSTLCVQVSLMVVCSQCNLCGQVSLMVVCSQCTLCVQVSLMVVCSQCNLCGQVFPMVVYYQCTLCGQVCVWVFTLRVRSGPGVSLGCLLSEYPLWPSVCFSIY